MSIACLVLNWNNYEDTLTCVNSLLPSGRELDIIVIDNGSKDKSGEKIDEEHPEVTVLYNDENLGFAGGMNTGIRYALRNDYDYIALVNNDVVFEEEGTIESLASIIDSTKFDALSPIIKTPSEDIWFERGKVSCTTGIITHRKSPNTELYGSDYLPLCATVFETGVFDTIGLLNEDYFLYVEDVDLALRASSQHLRFGVTKDHTAHHDAGSTSGGDFEDTYSYYNTRNQILLLQDNKDYFNITSCILLPIIIIYEMIIRLVNLELDATASVIKGAYDGLRRKRGKR